jgi:Zn-dependent alcohol dehydrogenase
MLAVEELDDPQPGPGEVLVRVAAVGLCRSDLSVLDGHGISPALPAVLGHEGAGVVEKVGPGVRTVSPGDHVVCSIVVSCGVCFQCRGGRLTLCEVGTRAAFAGGMLDGTTRLSQGGEPISQFFCQSSFAEYAVVPEVAAVPIPGDIPLDVAAVLGCGAMTGIGAVTRRAKVAPFSSVVVLGAGGVGLSAIMAARAVGARSVLAVDLSAGARDLALKLGATAAVDGGEWVKGVLAATGRGVDVVIDTVGTPGTLADSCSATRPGGDVVLVGLADAAAAVTLPMFELCLEKRVTGTYAGSVRPHVDIPNALELFRNGRLPLDQLVRARIQLEELPDAIAALRRGDARGRTVVVFPGVEGADGAGYA